MRILGGLLLLGLGAAAGVASDRLLVQPALGPGGVPAIERTEPQPGDPPLVWLTGTLVEVEEDRLALQDGDGPEIEVQRFAGTATRFYRIEDGRWQEADGETVASSAEGGAACIESLVDNETFLAIRVFLDTECGPR